MSVLGKEDPYLKIGQTNDRTTKGDSDYVWALRDISFKVEQGEVLGSFYYHPLLPMTIGGI